MSRMSRDGGGWLRKGEWGEARMQRGGDDAAPWGRDAKGGEKEREGRTRAARRESEKEEACRAWACSLEVARTSV